LLCQSVSQCSDPPSKRSALDDELADVVEAQEEKEVEEEEGRETSAGILESVDVFVGTTLKLERLGRERANTLDQSLVAFTPRSISITNNVVSMRGRENNKERGRKQ
jgi:hypothetical protein